MEEGGAEVEVLPVAAGEDEEGDDVDGEAEDGDGEHHPALDRGGMGEAAGGLDQDEGGDGEKRQAVDEGGHHRDAVEAVGAARVGRAAGDAEGEPRHGEGGEVGQHVAGVGEEREGAGDEAAGDLDNQERRR